MLLTERLQLAEPSFRDKQCTPASLSVEMNYAIRYPDNGAAGERAARETLGALARELDLHLLRDSKLEVF